MAIAKSFAFMIIKLIVIIDCIGVVAAAVGLVDN